MYGGHSLGYKDEDDLMFPMEDDEVIKRTGFMSSECLYCQTDTAKGRFFSYKNVEVIENPDLETPNIEVCIYLDFNNPH